MNVCKGEHFISSWIISSHRLLECYWLWQELFLLWWAIICPSPTTLFDFYFLKLPKAEELIDCRNVPSWFQWSFLISANYTVLRIANELVSAFRELWPFCLCRRPPWPRKGGGQCPHGLHNYVTCLLLPWSPAKILSLCKMTAYGQGGKGQASFYNYVTRSLVSLSKSTARGLTKDTLR